MTLPARCQVQRQRNPEAECEQVRRAHDQQGVGKVLEDDLAELVVAHNIRRVNAHRFKDGLSPLEGERIQRPAQIPLPCGQPQPNLLLQPPFRLVLGTRKQLWTHIFELAVALQPPELALDLPAHPLVERAFQVYDQDRDIDPGDDG